MKKIASAIASLMILASASAIAPVTASADSLVAFEIGTASTTGAVSDGKLVQEETVLVPLNVTENVGMTTFLLEFANDGNFELINATSDFGKGGDFKKLGSFTWNPEAQRVLWMEGSCRDTDLCGIIANLEVVIPSGTPVGKYEISFNEEEIQLTNSEFDSLEYTLTSGYIEVGGGEASAPAEEPQQTAPAVTQAPQPPATQAPVTTTKAPVTTTKAPVTTTKSASSTKASSDVKEEVTSRKNQAAPAENAAASTSKSAAETALEVTDALSTEISSDSTDVSAESTADISETSETAVSGGNASAKPSGNSNNNKINVSKTDKSPSTGATGVVIPSILLAASSVGVVIAASKKKKK